MTCQKQLMAEDKPYPRTCEECSLGPCKYDRPPGLPPIPRCEHGNLPEYCRDCILRHEIYTLVVPLVNEFYERRGGVRRLEHLLYRAYRMGMRHEEKPTP